MNQDPPSTRIDPITGAHVLTLPGDLQREAQFQHPTVAIEHERFAQEWSEMQEADRSALADPANALALLRSHAEILIADWDQQTVSATPTSSRPTLPTQVLSIEQADYSSTFSSDRAHLVAVVRCDDDSVRRVTYDHSSLSSTLLDPAEEDWDLDFSEPLLDYSLPELT